jgi:hypothetical protein
MGGASLDMQKCYQGSIIAIKLLNSASLDVDFLRKGYEFTTGKRVEI